MDVIRKQLKCSVCLDTYVKPKILKCHHVFCLKCLLRITPHKKKLTCPLCRKVTHIASRIHDLPEAFYMNQFLEAVSPPSAAATTLEPTPLTEAEALALAKIRWRQSVGPRKKCRKCKLAHPQKQQPQVSADFSLITACNISLFSSHKLSSHRPNPGRSPLPQNPQPQAPSFTPPLFPSPPSSPAEPSQPVSNLQNTPFQ